ncbi:metallophosphoesterase [Candidatus Koribacter versatilis Ellin345]|uniref:Metallophosphoesterase n=1 Tax=Koribacter versatilis (strain Ellin345) TaxID=204669 RepID=Q1IHA7_KORVE|nr:metallophosphoesterase [Candidatus Koribacter versatilis]ABF43743.1 metallophosphoesterase [Candidatus Koribacter versatilis Ellin345]
MRLRKLLGIFIFLCSTAFAQNVRIAQLSDLHLGLARAPQAADNLRHAVQMINDRGVDAVVVTGDIGEKPSDWDEAREILGRLKAPVYYIPGNHDIHANDFDRYRRVFGDDFYTVRVKNVVIYGLDSEVFGNYDNYDAAKASVPAPGDEAREAKAKMMRWLEESAGRPPSDRDKDKNDRDKDKRKGEKRDHDSDGDDHLVVIGMQHIPIARNGNFPPDARAYWFIPEADRQRECELLKRLGIHDMLVGHWHHHDEYEYCGIRWHVASATSWLTWGGELGFDIFTVAPNGELKDEFVPLGK